jgi:hypothetical protein
MLWRCPQVNPCHVSLCLIFNLHLPQKNFRTGIDALPKQTVTTCCVAVVSAGQNGLLQGQRLVQTVAGKILSTFCVGNSLMIEPESTSLLIDNRASNQSKSPAFCASTLRLPFKAAFLCETKHVLNPPYNFIRIESQSLSTHYGSSAFESGDPEIKK